MQNHPCLAFIHFAEKVIKVDEGVDEHQCYLFKEGNGFGLAGIKKDLFEEYGINRL